MERAYPLRIFGILATGFFLSFLIVGSSSALKSSIDKSLPADSLSIDPDSYMLLSLTNKARAAHGLKLLNLNNSLEQSARDKCQDMLARNYYGHIAPDGKNASDFIKTAGIRNYQQIGENLAIGQHSAAEVNDDWMASPGHRDNILNPNYTDVGFAECVYSSGLPGLDSMNIYIEHFIAR